eukprot:scaffold100881_cov28-Tisochrysis_lutea.AAC.8
MRRSAAAAPSIFAPGRDRLHRLHFSRKAKLMLPHEVHFQSPAAEVGALLPESACELLAAAFPRACACPEGSTIAPC